MVFEVQHPSLPLQGVQDAGADENTGVILENAIKDCPGNHVLETSISALGGASGPLT